jgi:hypothetical protein
MDAALGARIERQREVRVSLDIDEAGSDYEARNVNDSPGGQRVIGLDGRNAALSNRDVRAPRRGARAVDYFAPANQ